MKGWRFYLGTLAGLLAIFALPLKLTAQAPAEGIQVHGDWVIEVRNADGSLHERREFKNALTNGGRKDLVGLLGRAYAIQFWRVRVIAHGSVICPSAGFCTLTEPNDQISQGHAGIAQPKNLTLTPKTTDPAELTLRGSFVANGDGSISRVSTEFVRNEQTAPDFFTDHSLASPIAVQATQSVSVSVTFSFQ